jgi:hypothetical protein
MNIDEFDEASSRGYDECYASYREAKSSTLCSKMAYQLRRIVNRFEDELDENKLQVLDDLIAFTLHLKNKIGEVNVR